MKKNVASKKLQEKNTCEGEVEKVDVGGGPHVLVLDDHQAGGQVAKDSQHQEQTVKIRNSFFWNRCT